MSESEPEAAKLSSVAPVLPVTSVADALTHYAKLGFKATSYGSDAEYGYLERDDVHLHVAQVVGLDPKTSMVAAYLYVNDAKALHAEWHNAGVNGRMIKPTDTDYGLCEGAHIDPDGNLVRFGSPIR